jgi:hypothetical protein
MYVGGFLWFAGRYIVRAPLTYLVAMILLYRYRLSHSASPPLTGAEFALWVDGLDSTMQAAILGSLVTVVGFLMSFSIGTKQWRSQKEAEILLQMTDDVHSFFSRAADSTRTLSRVASRLIKLQKLMNAGLPLDVEGMTLVKLLEGDILPMLEARRQLLRAAIEVHDIRSKYSVPITSSPIGYWGFQQATKYLERISELVYFTSEVNPADTAAVSIMYRDFDETMAAELVAINDHDVPKMLGAASISKGGAFSKVVRPNFWSVFFTGGMLNSVAKSNDD